MKWLERAAWAMAILGLLFRWLHWPMAGVLCVLGFSMAAMLYFPLGWLVLGRPTRKDQLIPLSVLTGMVLGALCIGMLFKLQLWPVYFAQLYLTAGLFGAVVVMVAIASLHSRNPGIEHYFKGLRLRLLLIGIPALLLYLVPTDRLVGLIHRDDPERGALIMRILTQPEDTAAYRQLEELDRQRSGR